MANPRPPTPPIMRARKRQFSYWHEAARLVGNRCAQRFCPTFGRSPILRQTSSLEQLLSTRPIPDMLHYQQPPGPSLHWLSPVSQVLWPRLTSVGSAMPSSMGYTLRCVPHRPPRIRCNSLHSMQPPHLRDRVRVVWDFDLYGSLVRSAPPYMRFLFVGSKLCPARLIVSPCHPASFRFHLAVDTLAFD